MTRPNWMTQRRTGQLIEAAGDGRLYFDPADILRHRSTGSRESDLAAHRRDVEIVACLITTGRLRRDEAGVVVPDFSARHTDLANDLGQVLDVEAGLRVITKEQP